jgi:hypothetical protein
MKQRAETKADIEEKIDQCNRRLGLISDNLNELKAARADLEDWQRNLSLAEQDRFSYRKCGAMTHHTASVRSVWYRLTRRLCCRVVGVHMKKSKVASRNPLESPRAR